LAGGDLIEMSTTMPKAGERVVNGRGSGIGMAGEFAARE
jgi:hypothetical protein